MNLGRFFLDQWRLALFFFLALSMTLTVLCLALGFGHVHVPVTDIAYSALLAAACFVVYGLIEYAIRLPVYREIRIQLEPDSPLHAADTFTLVRTAEQALFVGLLHHHYRSYARELAALEERRQFFEVFTMRFAHQMKTPVTVLQLLEQDLRSQVLSSLPSSQEWLTKLDTLAEECHQLNQSLGAMIHTARLDAFEFDSVVERMDVVSVLRDVINAYKSEWIHKSMFPKIVCDESSVWIKSDKKWLRFVIQQIVRNGLQYGTSRNKQRHTFEIRVQSSSDAVTLQFMDEGIGIPAKDVRRVFDPFFTGENGRTHSRSTGMGLYLVREITEKLGHSVSIASEEGRGTTVTLVIPQASYYSPAYPNLL